MKQMLILVARTVFLSVLAFGLMFVAFGLFLIALNLPWPHPVIPMFLGCGCVVAAFHLAGHLIA